MINLNNYGLSSFCQEFNINYSGDYHIEYIKASNLISIDRLDLISKLLYVENYIHNLNSNFIYNLYKRNIEICTLGTYSEFDNQNKNSFDDFCNIFNRLIEDIKLNGFNENISIIPLGKNGIILNGSHRVAIAAYFNLHVPTIKFNIDEPKLNVSVYKNRLSLDSDIDFLVTEMCKYNSDLFLCCIWPAADSHEDKRLQAANMINDHGNLIHAKRIHINYNGLHNLIPQIYVKNDWVGNVENRFLTATLKVNGCSGEGPLDIYLFRCTSLENVKLLKVQLREIFGIAENSLHITDFPQETLFLSQMLFNENTIIFLNNSDPFKYISLNKKLFEFKNILENNNINTDDYIIDSSSVMGLYGIREPNDIDFLTISTDDFKFNVDYISNHLDESHFYNENIVDIIKDPSNFFYYFGLKFIILNRLKEFKLNRYSIKDRADIILIDKYLEGDFSFSMYFIKSFQFLRRKLRNIIFLLLRKLPFGGYFIVRDIYHILRNFKLKFLKW